MSQTPPFEYHILEMLGRGGMGRVFRAEMHGPDTSVSGGFTKVVAVKLLNPEVEGNADLVQRLRDEARMLGLVRHRAIVQVDRLLRFDEGWAIVMEYVAGLDVAELLLRYGPLPLGPALEVVGEVAAALHVAYNAPPEGGSEQMEPLRLVHRDVKPANIRVTPSGGVKLLDFGVAQASFPGREAHTDSLRYGSTRYMSPQRLCWEDDGPAGDVYSLGAVLYELLAGRPLGLASDQPDVHAQIVGKACGGLRALRAGRGQRGQVPDEVIELIRDCLSFTAGARPDARTFVQRARRAAEHDPTSLQEWVESLPAFDPPQSGPTELSSRVLRESAAPSDGGDNLTLEWPPLPPSLALPRDRSIVIADPTLPRRRRWRPMRALAVFALALLGLAVPTAFLSSVPAVQAPEGEVARPVVPCAIDVAGPERAQVAAVDSVFRAWQVRDVALVDQALSPDFQRRNHQDGKSQDRASFLDQRAKKFERATQVKWTGERRDAEGYGVPQVEGDIAVRCRENDHLRVVVRYDWVVTYSTGQEKAESSVVDAYELDENGLIVENIDYADLNMALAWRDGCCL